MDQADHPVEGYVLCARGGHCWVRDEVAQRTGGLCPEDFALEGGAVLRTVELVGRGLRVHIPLVDKPRRRVRHLSEDRKARKKAAAKAGDSARKRLAAMFPDLYDIVLADERATLGLEPWPVDIAARGGDAATEISFAAMMIELEQNGIDTR